MTTIRIKKALWKERFPHKALDMIIQYDYSHFMLMHS